MDDDLFNVFDADNGQSNVPRHKRFGDDDLSDEADLEPADIQQSDKSGSTIVVNAEATPVDSSNTEVPSTPSDSTAVEDKDTKPDVSALSAAELKDSDAIPGTSSSSNVEKRKIHEVEGESDEEDESKRPRVKDEVEQLQKSLPQISVEDVDVPPDAGFTHQVAIPMDGNNPPLKPITTPVRTFSYKLDHFQDRAVTIVDNYQSVMVSAHTSAGKTTIAEYAIAKGLKDRQRVIYTTPIKALSNQKYRQFDEAFKDVGLITGDVTMNPSASCLIMTTEILRNMLYRGSEIMREVGWVIFDEIHYMRDKERGVVWEETLILLPQKTHYVFLSATIPNAVEFAQWISYMHHQPCHVIHTDYRPVPLHHYIYPVGGEGIHLVVDEHGNFKEDGFSTAMSYLQVGDTTNGPKKRQGGNFRSTEDSPCYKVIKMAMENDLAPMIIFSFSKKDCEVFATQLKSLDFNTADDKVLVEEVFTNAIDVLNKEDQKLPQVENLLPILKRGIGIHHGGLLPLLKETIEILFAEGLIKVLFATETFAMGLNMPARTVAFTNVRKYDGKTYRWITSGEYIQMSGRAGRRGIDDKGVSIVMIDEKITSNVGRSLLKGLADPINSAFYLTYNMVLNLMRVEEINPEFMMERSFYQFQNYNKVPVVIQKLSKAEAEYNAIEIPNEEEVAAFYNLRVQLANFAKNFQDFITMPKHIVPFLQPGRMVYIKKDQFDFGWGAVVNFKKVDNRSNPMKLTTSYIVEVLIHVSNSCSNTKFTTELRPPSSGERGEMKVVPMTLNVIQKISQVRLYFSNDLRPVESRLSVLRSIEEVIKRFPDGVPLLDPLKDMKIKDDKFLQLIKNIDQFEQRLYKNHIHNSPNAQRLYEMYERKSHLHNKVQEAKLELKEAKSLLQMDELKCRKRVLRRLGYCSEGDVIQLKGRVACELSSADELLLTEMLFYGTFVDLEPAKATALLSCLVCDERSNDTPKLTDDLSGALKTMQEMARQIARVSKECKLEIDEDEYVERFKPYLMDVVYEWCKGASFAKLCEMTDIFEGGIIRCMRRLEELLRQMSLAAKVIGNKDLEEKFNEGVKLLKRDIVFAASLYL